MNPDEIHREIAATEERVRPHVESFNYDKARISEFIVTDPDLPSREPLTANEIEVAITLNAVAESIHNRALEAAERDDVKWEGLAAAVTLLRNEIALRGLPPVARFDFG